MCLKRIKDWLKKITENGSVEPPLPALANTFLFVEPDDNYLDYGSAVLTSLVNANKSGAQKVVEIKGVQATPSNVKAQLLSVNPMVFSGLGHGNYSTYTVQAQAVFLQVGDNNVPLMKDRIVHLNSCETGAELGPAIKEAGAIAYSGSNESFWFYTGDMPNASRAVQSVFLAEYQFDVSLLQGKTVDQAHADQLAKFDSELNYWISGDGRTHPDAADIARMLNINKAIITYLADGGGTTTPSPGGTAPSGGLSLPPEVTVPATFAGAFALIWYLLR